MITNYDAVAAMYNWLKEDAGVGPAAIRALVYGGAAGIYEQADLRQGILTENVTARQAAGQRTRVLAITVHDLGENYTGGQFVQQVGITLWDRSNGQDVLRSVRETIKYYIAKADDTGWTMEDMVTKDVGALEFMYNGRTGFRQSVHYMADYDMLTYSARISWNED